MAPEPWRASSTCTPTCNGPGIGVRAATGSFGRRTGAITASRHGRTLSANLAVELDGEGGDFEYVNIAHFPPRAVERRGGDRRRNTLFGTVQWRKRDTKVRSAVWVNTSERGLPSVHSFQNRRERQWDRNTRLWTTVELPVGRAKLIVKGMAQRGQRRYVNPLLRIDDTGRTFVSSTESELRTRQGPRWQVGVGLSAGYARARHPRVEADRWHGAAFVSSTGTYGALRIYPALRLDYYSGPIALNPRLGANLRIVQNLHLKISTGRAFRMPTFNDLYWRPGGNPTLLPELGWTHDAGIRWEHSRGSFEVTAFASRFTNQIVWQPSTAGYWSPSNIDRLLSRGLEATGSWRLSVTEWLGLETRSVFTSTHSRIPDANGDKPVRLFPARLFKTQISTIAGPFSVGVSVRLIDQRAVTLDGGTMLPGFSILDAAITYQVSDSHTTTTFTLRSENFLNAEYEHIPNSPMPPRVWLLAYTLNLH